jgi:hypothetical protein
MYEKIRLELEERLLGKQLTDAHRHSLYDIGKVKNMENLSVEEWNKYEKFINYQKKTKKLFDKELFNEIKDWLEFSRNENIRTILDFSAKHASNDLKSIYNKYNIKSFSPLKWTKLSEIRNNNIPQFIILPDERLLTKELINIVIAISNQYPTIKFTMHCLESVEHKKIAFKKFGMSTIEWLDKNNFLNNKFFLVHVNEISDNDIDLIRKNNVKIILCPLMREPLNYNNAKIQLDLDIYFGTDAPLISKNRSLIDVAIYQAIIWLKQGEDFDNIIEVINKALTKDI